jgi:hypothetical protein
MTEPEPPSVAELRRRAGACEQEAAWLRSSGKRLAKELSARLADEAAARRRAEKRLDELLGSRTWAVGRAVVSVPKAIRALGRRRGPAVPRDRG